MSIRDYSDESRSNRTERRMTYDSEHDWEEREREKDMFPCSIT